MKIALVSDSHGSKDRMRILCKNLNEKNILNVLHAGDLFCYGIEEVFADFKDINFYIALGNNDFNSEIRENIEALENCFLEEVVDISLNNVHFGISHIEGVAQGVLKDQKIDVFCHGHTHRAKAEKRNDNLVLNPGALCEDGGYFLLDTKKKDLGIERRLFSEEI